MKDMVIIGAGGFGREVAWLIEDINKEKKEWNLLGFVDDNMEKGKFINGYTVLGSLSFFEGKKDIYYVCAIGNAKVRKKIVEEIKTKYSIKPAILIHPSVNMRHEDNALDEGCIVCAGCIITTNVKIGKFNIINLNCTIGHDVVMKDFVTLYPAVNVSGKCTINECVEIGTGTQIIQGKSVGEGSIIGAGTVVVKDLPENITAVGVPAKIIKTNK